MYMFGFAASFNDTIVHFTDIQMVDSVWTDSKTEFLLGRENYSYQLRDYLAAHQMPHRTCIVVYNKDRKKLEKKFLKMRKLYNQPKKGQRQFDIRYIESRDMQFKPVDMSDPVTVETESEKND